MAWQMELLGQYIIDSSGVIWLGHNGGGITRYHEGSFSIVLNVGTNITSFNEDHQGNLWISSFAGGVMKTN